MSFEVKNWDDMLVDDAINLDMAIFTAIKFYDLASLGDVAIKAVVERLNLERFLEYFEEFNSSHELPYHNRYHTYCVVLNLYEGAFHEKLTISESRALVAAGLLHDMNHSGGLKPDRENVDEAIIQLGRAQSYAGFSLLGLSPEEFEIAKRCINVTKYPYERQPTSIHEMMIRDADLMQPYENNRTCLIAQYLGLKEEIETNGSKFTNQEFSELSDKFLSAVEWHTKWAAEKAKVRNWELKRSILKEAIASA